MDSTLSLRCVSSWGGGSVLLAPFHMLGNFSDPISAVLLSFLLIVVFPKILHPVPRGFVTFGTWRVNLGLGENFRQLIMPWELLIREEKDIVEFLFHFGAEEFSLLPVIRWYGVV